jgi:hypothetical protein
MPTSLHLLQNSCGIGPLSSDMRMKDDDSEKDGKEELINSTKLKVN